MSKENWHGYGQDWVPHFIHEYRIEINRLAWSGYQHQGQGMMMCEVDCPREGPIGDLKTVRRHFSYLSLGAAIQHLHRLELSRDEICNLDEHLRTYNPKQETMVLITGKGEILVVLIRNLALAEIYEQPQTRMTELLIPGHPN